MVCLAAEGPCRRAAVIREEFDIGFVRRGPHLHYHLQNGPQPFLADGLPVQFTDVVVDGKRVARAEIEKGSRVRPQC